MVYTVVIQLLTQTNGGFSMKSEVDVPIQRLIELVEAELLRTGYGDRVIKRYQRVWSRLTNYMEERFLVVYNTKVGLNFLDVSYQITVFKALTNENKVRARAVQVLNDYHLHGVIFPKYTSSSVSLLSHHSSVLEQFQEYRKQFQISKSTLKSYEKYIGKFLLFMERRSVADLSQITASSILDFTNIFAGYSSATSHNSLAALRVFLRYLHATGTLDKDFSNIVPHVRYRRDARIPSAFSKEDVHRVLESVDRSSPKGKRDYAMLLLASELGLRSGDIRNLSFSNLHWDKNTIELTMSKTGKPVILPLLEKIGMAIINYVKYGRPQTDSTCVFLRHISPIQPLTASALTAIVKQYISIAGIDVKPGQSQGPHAMRHSLASALLEDNVPLPIISEILGHTDSRTTGVYLKIDVNQLRNCALDVPPFDWNVNLEVF
jgi:integrase/recombinase XerD